MSAEERRVSTILIHNHNWLSEEGSAVKLEVLTLDISCLTASSLSLPGFLSARSPKTHLYHLTWLQYENESQVEIWIAK